MTDSTLRPDLERRLNLQRNLRIAVDAIGMEATTPVLSAGERRRMRGVDVRPGHSVMTLVERQGIFHLQEEQVASTSANIQRRAAGFFNQRRTGQSPSGISEEVYGRIPFRKLKRDQVRQKLEDIDRNLTPAQGLREWRNGNLYATAEPIDKGKILLLVHGTFSNSEALLNGMRQAPNGVAFLDKAKTVYDQILCFDHPTLSVGPVVNARQLATLLAPSEAIVDVICHSRGGLVSRWWAEGMERGKTQAGRIVYAGAPLAGTGLAAAPNIRASLDLLANISAALGAASAAVPFLTVAAGLFQVVSSVARFTAKAPIADALIALIPGLRAMSRVGNNAEILALRGRFGDLRGRHFARGRYFAVTSNFEPEDPGWAFWRYFRNIKQRALDISSEIVFDGKNDLVVDTHSMTELDDGFGLPQQQILDFEKLSLGHKVHHTNYFEQRESIDFFEHILLDSGERKGW